MASTGDNGSKNVTPPEDENKRSSVDEPSVRRGILWRSLVVGPDAVEEDEPEGLLEVLLPWPVRFLGVAAAFLAAWFWRDSGIGQQIAWGLQVGALAAVAIVASFWLPVLVVDSVMAAVWLLPFQPPEGRRRRWSLLHVIAFLNRQLGHIAALFVWILVSFGVWTWLPGQIGASFAVILLGPPVLNGLARIRVKNVKGIAAHSIGFVFGSDGFSKFSGELLWRRRVLIYLATAVGLGVMVFAAPKQTLRLLPLILAISVGMAIRIVRHWRRRKRVREELVDGEKNENIKARADFRREQARAARNADLFAPVLVLGGFMLLVGASYWQRQKLEDSLRTAFEDTKLSSDGCTRDTRGPEKVDISLFVMADTQMHSLAGEPFPGQSELVEAFIKSAKRPLALEMLSAVPLKHFDSVYAKLKENRPNILWAYLGDLADLGCRSELERMYALLKDFVRVGPLAGITIGNHEVSFQGSFHWSPYWNAACASEPVRKDEVSRDIVKNFANEIKRNKGEFLRLESSFLNFRGGSLSTVSPLGVVEQSGRTVGVIGVFLDTSDGKAFDNGMPGSTGAVSLNQLNAVRKAIDRLKSRKGGPYADDPVYVVFAHIPYGELSGSSRDRVSAFLNDLDGKSKDLDAEPRVLAMITAHKHVALTQRHCVGNRWLREIMVGSTIDSPQQAALVEIGTNTQGQLALSVRTLQTVARPNQTCDDDHALPASRCHQVAAELLATPACRDALSADADDSPPRDCQILEQPMSLKERLAALRSFRGPRDVDQKRRLQQLEARRLLSCICRDGICNPGKEPLNGEAHAENLRQALSNQERGQELVCLAWAASACQAHKGTGMTLGEALRCAFDDPSMPPESVTVATLESAICF